MGNFTYICRKCQREVDESEYRQMLDETLAHLPCLQKAFEESHLCPEDFEDELCNKILEYQKCIATQNARILAMRHLWSQLPKSCQKSDIGKQITLLINAPVPNT